MAGLECQSSCLVQEAFHSVLDTSQSTAATAVVKVPQVPVLAYVLGNSQLKSGPEEVSHCQPVAGNCSLHSWCDGGLTGFRSAQHTQLGAFLGWLSRKVQGGRKTCSVMWVAPSCGLGPRWEKKRCMPTEHLYSSLSAWNHGQRAKSPDTHIHTSPPGRI